MSALPPETDPTLDRLVAAVRESAKNRSVCTEVIRNVGRRELLVRRGWKDAVKETKNTLHQIAGAYCAGRFRYEEWLGELSAAMQAGDAQQFRSLCVTIMESHASTRERLPELERFYAEVFAQLPPVRSILDIACGLNPVAIPWMPLEPGASYMAYDLFEDMADFLNGFFPLAGVTGRAVACDVGVLSPPEEVDVAFVFKVLPPLERVDKHAPLRLLKAIRAPRIVVSYPTRSLGGHNRNMERHYEERFHETVREEGWDARRFLIANELCFLITKG